MQGSLLYARFLCALLVGGACAEPLAPYEGEQLGGGETTNILAIGSQAFTFPASNISRPLRTRFFTGNAFFNQAWVAAPATTTARDGVGPMFHARSCSACHFRDGRGAPPEEGGLVEEGVVKLAVVRGGQAQPDARYGAQLQPFGIEGVLGEASPVVRWTEEPGVMPDGTAYSLRKPTLTLEAPAYGDFDDMIQTGIRMAPGMVGLGLLEAIRVEDIEALEDPDDADGDGVSGRTQRVDGVLGRFGWRAGAPNIDAQIAGAFSGDMGLTSALRPDEQCTDAQPECTAAGNGNDAEGYEVSANVFEAVGIYSRVLAVPARRSVANVEVLAGRELMKDLGCTSCHAERFITGPADIPALAEERIFPYTDLLLHDMGEGLADGVPEHEASGSEWRTPPLWGIGLIEAVNGHLFLMHDGRARGFEEAILWHRGEGEGSRARYMSLSPAERAQLIRFLESL